MPSFKFELESRLNSGEKTLIQTPVSWDSNKPTLTRDDTYHGVIRSFTVGLTFVRDGYSYLKELYDADSILAECLIYIYEHDNSAHEFVLQDIGKIDFSSWDEADVYKQGVTLTITDTAFAEKIRGREDTEINYNNSVDLDDNPMSSPKYVEQTILGMDVISKGAIQVPEQLASFEIRTEVPPGSFYRPGTDFTGQTIRGNTIPSHFNPVGTAFDIENECFFIAEADGTISIDGSLNFDMFVDNGINLPEDSYVRFIKRYTEPTGGLLGITLKEWQSSGSGSYTGIELDITGDYSILKGEALYFSVKNGGASSTVENNGDLQLYATELELIQKDKAGDTISKGALLFDCFDRSIEAVSGVEGSLISDVLSDGGEFHDYTVQNGFLIRNYLPVESALSWKFKEFFQNIEKVFNIGLAINSDNTVEIRKKQDFFQQGVIHTVSKADIEADSFSRVIDTDYFFSDVEIGYTKSAYEEISGLEEYNNKSFYNTILSILNNKLDGISKIRGDGYGIEFARRKQKTEDTTEDTKYDSDLFLLNVILDGLDYKQLTTEGFSNVSGIDQIETPTNLKITPGQNLRRWGWMLATGLQKYQDKTIKFNKSDFQSDLSTTLNGLTVNESEDLTYAQLDAPIFTGHKLIFTAKLSLTDYNKIKSSPYQLIEAWNPISSEFTYGWLREIGVEAVDKSTNWELIEAIEAIKVLQSWLTNEGTSWLWNSGEDILLNEQS